MMAKKIKGFGVLETVLACGIIIMVVGAVVALSNYGIQNSVINKHKIQAYTFAQEATEELRNIRDSKWANATIANNWTFTPPITWRSPSGIYLNTPANPFPGFIIGDTAGGDSRKETIQGVVYTRYIYIYQSTSNNSLTIFDDRPDTVIINIRVAWSDYGKTREILLKTTLTNWKSL